MDLRSQMNFAKFSLIEVADYLNKTGEMFL